MKPNPIDYIAYGIRAALAHNNLPELFAADDRRRSNVIHVKYDGPWADCLTQYGPSAMAKNALSHSGSISFFHLSLVRQ